MYVPEHFRESNLSRLFDIVERYPFATLISTTEGVPFVSHVPFVVERDRGPKGTLLGHVARANPHWRQLASSPNVLVVFTGPHAYVSPTWYALRPENVPTWNYAVVHARGPVTLLEGGRATLALLQRLTGANEPQTGSEYVVRTDDATLENVSRGVVAFEIAIAELTGKFKLSQNRSEADRGSVREHLAGSGDPLVREVGSLMGQT